MKVVAKHRYTIHVTANELNWLREAVMQLHQQKYEGLSGEQISKLNDELNKVLTDE